MNTPANVKPYKTMHAQLTTGQRWSITITRLFYGVLAANLMIRSDLFLSLLPVLLLPGAVWAAARKSEQWHGALFPQGYKLLGREGFKPLYIKAAVAGVILTGVLIMMELYATFFGAYLFTILGICFLTTFFFTKGVLAGWARVVDPSDTTATISVEAPKKVQNETMWNAVFGCLIFALVFNILSYREVVTAADAQVSQRTEQDGLVAAMSGASSDVQTPDQSSQAPQEQPQPAPVQQAPASQPVQDEVMTAPTAPVPAADTQSGLTARTYGNAVAAFNAAEPPKDALQDALSKVIPQSSLTVIDVDSSGYPVYGMECEADGHCVNDGGLNLGSEAEAAVQMFPVNPSDISRLHLMCDPYLCRNSQGSVIGRSPSA